MGAYMSKPSTEKSSHSGFNEWISFGVSSMQGWRMQQEDAHNCELEFDKSRSASLFAVYDGHGGAEVARYCANYLPQFLRDLPAYANGTDLSETLKQLFLDFDASLTTAETRDILRRLADSDKENNNNQSSDEAHGNPTDDDDDAEESDSEISALRAEANQPLESVLERYGGEDALPSSIKDLLEYRRRTKVGECSTSSSPSKKTVTENSTSADSESTKQTPDTETTNPPSKDEATTESKSATDSDKAETETNSTTDGENANCENQLQQTKKSSKDSHAASEEDEADDDEDDESVELNDDDDNEDDESDDEASDDEEFDDDDEDDDEDDDDSEDTDSDEGDDEADYEAARRLGIPALLKEEDSEPGVDSGTTACVALLLPVAGCARLYVANAGDSRAVLCRGRAAVDLSVDHKPEDEDEKARIHAAGGTVTRDGRVNGGLNLSRALGDHNYKQTENLSLAEQMITPSPDVTQFDLIPGSDEFLVLACDGVWNSMTSQEVVDFIYDRLHAPETLSASDKVDNNQGAESDRLSDTSKTVKSEDTDAAAAEAAKLSKICEEIFDRCLAPNTDGDGTGCDNMTCIIVHFKNLEALVKRSLSTEKSETTNALTVGESRKRSAERKSNGAAANGLESTSSTELDPFHAKRSKQDAAEVAVTVSNGNAS